MLRTFFLITSKHVIENINFQQHSVLERGTFYKDAVKLWSDYPIIGAGGGAWASLYEKYQNNPYTSRQAHNFALQYLVEAGALGFLAFIGFVIAVSWFYIRSYIKKLTRKARSSLPIFHYHDFPFGPQYD
jgi:O-antigen ligase